METKTIEQTIRSTISALIVQMDLTKILDTTPEPHIVALTTTSNTSGDYCLPVPMCEYQQQLTDQVVSLHYADILKYFETNDKDQLLLESLETLYLNSQLVATHPCLLIEQYFPKNLTAKDTPLNLALTSGKFQVLKDVLTLLEDTEFHVAVVARPGQTLDLIEALVLGVRSHIRRHAGVYIRDPSKPTKQAIVKTLTTHIVSSTLAENTFNDDLGAKFDLVFSFDITSKIDLLQSLRKTPTTPVLRFITANSIDHVAYYFRKFYSDRSREYLVDVTAATVVLRDRVGVLPPDLRPIYAQDLKYLSPWFHDFQSPWPLPELSEIKKYDAGDVERSLLTEVVFEKKGTETSKKSLYETKRLNKDYNSNPLNSSNLIGILQTNSNYDSTLTHKLIQDLNCLRVELDLQDQCFANLEFFESNEKDFLKQDEAKLIEEFSHYKQRVEITSSKNDKLTQDIETQKVEIQSLKAKNEENTIWSLKDQFKAESKKKESLTTEKSYMEKEINNAQASATDFIEEITKVKVLISQNEHAFEKYFDGFPDETVGSDDVNTLKEKLTVLKYDVKQNLNKLNTGSYNRARS